MRIPHRFATVLAVDEPVDVVHRSRPVQRQQRRQVRRRLRLQIRHRPPHPARFQLEDAEGLAPGQHVERRRIAIRQRFQIDPFAGLRLDQLDGRLQDRQVREAEEVHLQQPHRGHLVHRPLRHRNRVFVVRARRPPQRHVFRQRALRDHHRRRMGARMAHDAVQPLRLPQQFRRRRVRLLCLAQLFGLLDRFLHRDVQLPRHEPRQPVRFAQRHAERAPRVPNRRLRAQRPEGDDLRDPIPPVLLRHVADHLVPPVVGEVHVDVRHLLPLRVQEALEHQPVFHRVDVGDADAVEDQAARGAPAHSLGDPLPVREIGEIPHDQEILGESGLLHHRQLVLEPLDVLRRRLHRQPLLQPLPRDLREVLDRRLALGQVGLRQPHPSELERHVAALRDRVRLVQGLRQIVERPPHVRFIGQVEVLAVEFEPLFVVQSRVRADAQQQLVRVVVARLAVVGVLRRRQLQPRVPRQLHRPLQDRLELLERLVPLHLEVVAPLEDLAVPRGDPVPLFDVALLERPGQLARRAARQADQPV